MQSRITFISLLCALSGSYSTSQSQFRAQFAGKVAVVFSWHVGIENSDVRWGSRLVGNAGNMFAVAVKSVNEAHPELPIYLFTNGHVADLNTASRIEIIQTDLMEEAGLYELYNKHKDMKIGFGTKAQSVITGI